MGKEKPQLDAAQKAAVVIDKNAVVSAGAGSGKTSVLSKRFTELLVRDKDCKVEQILTLTFTKKATVEMNGRIYKELAEVCPDKARDFYKANIKTLDSYCSQVAKLGSRYYGVSPDFAIDEETITERIQGLALPFILKHRDNGAIKALVATRDFSDIADQLFVKTIMKNSTVAKNIDFEKNLTDQYEVVRQKWAVSASRLVNLRDDLKKLVDSYDGNRTTKYIVGLNTCLETEPDEIPEIDFNNSNDESRLNFVKYFSVLSDVSQKGTKDNVEAIKSVHNEIKEVFPVLCQLENYIYGNQFVLELIPLLKEFEALVNNTKRSLGILTYADAASLAINTLIDHPEIRKIEKEKYRYIMIDEFQDNNSMQRDLLFLLAEKNDRMEKSLPKVEELDKNKLFFVGDEKQSIYKFRGADVSVFRGLSNDFKDGNLELKTNYRSHPALIAGFNTIFGGVKYPPCNADDQRIPCVFYTEKDVQTKNNLKQTVPDYEAVYHDVEIPEHKQKEIKKGNYLQVYEPRIHFAFCDKDAVKEAASLDADNTECYWVTQKIKSLLNGDYGKMYQAKDIAILFKSYTLLPVYEKLLLREGIPFVSETVKGFFADGPVNDIMSFLRLVAYPKNSLSYANILRSPFVNLNAKETNVILAGLRQNSSDMENLFDFNVEGLLESQSQKRYAECAELYSTIRAMAKKESIARLISHLWYVSGYRYETLWNKTVYMYASAYDRLFELARQADLDNTGLSAFVDSIDSYQSESEKLDGMEIPLESSDGVHIMSIHKSKGLEFPVVFICGTGHSGMRDMNSSVSYTSKEYGLTINTPPSPVCGNKSNFFFEFQKEESNRMACAELRRLTYVALTRAEERLFITGSIKQDELTKHDYSPDGDAKAEKISQILFPSLNQFLDEDGIVPDELKACCPFTMEWIEPVAVSAGKVFESERSKIIAKVSGKYAESEIIEKKEPVSVYASPSQLHSADEENSVYSMDTITVDSKIPYSEIDTLVLESVSAKKREPEFKYSNFGTIAHAYMEWAVTKQEPYALNKEIVGLHGNEAKLKILDGVCRKMQSQFLKSQPGKDCSRAIEAGNFYRSEYSFKCLIGKKIINGQIDLVFENPDKDGLTVVDYKTNREIKPEIYYIQLACYRRAISQMLGISEDKVKCMLYYLRYGKEVDVTEGCNSVDLETAVNAVD